ncbi:MAG: zinc ribbon domain-containing protein [Muricoprocola sp.]
MLEKWKKWALQMNLKKAVFIFAAVSVVSVLGLFAAMCGIFKRKAFQWESVIVFLTVCGIIEVVLVIWYWILCLICAYRKSNHIGSNSTLWVLATVFFNLFAIMALYLYAAFRGTCSNCGKIKTGEGKYCDRCGAPLNKECPHCGQIIDINADYCSNCGTKMNENKEEQVDR